MGQHIYTAQADADRGFAYRCKCGWHTGWHTTGQLAHDETFKHDRAIERIRTSLGTKNPSLKTQARVFREQAEKADDPEAKRLFNQLADEIDKRLNATEPIDQPGLF